MDLGLKIPDDRVIELDWWDSVTYTNSEDVEGAAKVGLPLLRVTCTPAQHGSGEPTDKYCVLHLHSSDTFALHR